MLYLLRGVGRGNALRLSSEGCFKDDARKALAFIAIPVALTGRPREDLTLGEEGPADDTPAGATDDALSKDWGRSEALDSAGGC
jgi:hypothetical protein